MSQFTAATLAAPVAPGLLKLDPRAWSDKLRAFAILAAEKRRLDAEARAADSVFKAARDEILGQLGDAPAAICGDMVITRKTTKAAPASLTLSNGQVVPWATVSGLTIGNAYVAASDVLRLYGGRDGSVSVSVDGGGL
jgi:hypothetical protein